MNGSRLQSDSATVLRGGSWSRVEALIALLAIFPLPATSETIVCRPPMTSTKMMVLVMSVDPQAPDNLRGPLRPFFFFGVSGAFLVWAPWSAASSSMPCQRQGRLESVTAARHKVAWATRASMPVLFFWGGRGEGRKEGRRK